MPDWMTKHCAIAGPGINRLGERRGHALVIGRSGQSSRNSCRKKIGPRNVRGPKSGGEEGALVNPENFHFFTESPASVSNWPVFNGKGCYSVSAVPSVRSC